MPRGSDHGSSSDRLEPSEGLGPERDGDDATAEYGARGRGGLTGDVVGMAFDEFDLIAI